MSFSGAAHRAAEQQKWLRELEGARSLLCQSSSRMLLNSRNAGEHQLAAAEQPAATPRSRREKQSFQSATPRRTAFLYLLRCARGRAMDSVV